MGWGVGGQDAKEGTISVSSCNHVRSLQLSDTTTAHYLSLSGTRREKPPHLVENDQTGSHYGTLGTTLAHPTPSIEAWIPVAQLRV